MTLDNTCWPTEISDYEGEPKSLRPRKHPEITRQMHDKIKVLYQNRVECSGEIGEFADQHNIPRWKLSRYAIRQGWIEKERKEPPWSEDELEILERQSKHCPEVIQRRLKAAGFIRSVTGIVIKRKRMRFLSNLNGITSQQLAHCLGVDVHFVLRAIRAGEIHAQVRQDKRTTQQGGHMHYITDPSIKKFIVENIHKINLKKVDKYWLIDILTGVKE